MARVTTDSTYYTQIANAIRNKLGTVTKYLPRDMANAINTLLFGASDLQTKTVTAGTSAKNVAPDSGKVGLSQVTVNPTPSESKTVTPSTSQQTITPANGKLLSQVIVNGDTNLSSANIISGKTIFGVSGGVVIQKYYTGSSAPSSSLGNNGDIYLRG